MKPMLCAKAHQTVPGTLSDKWIAEPKLDGWRGLCGRDPVGRVFVKGGRNAADYTGRVPYLEADLGLLPPDTIVDGEIVSPWGWGEVQSIMTTHRPHTGFPKLVFYCFDVLRWEGQDLTRLPWSARRKYVERVDSLGVEHVRPTLVIQHPTQKVLDVVLGAGFEGLVLKHIDKPYSYDRSPWWQKVKPQQTLEGTVIGFKAGENGFTGLVGAIEFQLDTGATGFCSGFSMPVRQDITANKDQWIGRTIEIKHHGVSKDGKLRHPQFLRVRSDLEAAVA